MIEIKINGETVTSKVIPRNPEELQADFLRVLLVLVMSSKSTLVAALRM